MLPVGSPYSGKTKVAFCTRLGDDWRKLADYLEAVGKYPRMQFKVLI
jgi:hypothetical protein